MRARGWALGIDRTEGFSWAPLNLGDEDEQELSNCPNLRAEVTQ
jgi:hypothetical protein